MRAERRQKHSFGRCQTELLTKTSWRLVHFPWCTLKDSMKWRAHSTQLSCGVIHSRCPLKWTSQLIYRKSCFYLQGYNKIWAINSTGFRITVNLNPSSVIYQGYKLRQALLLVSLLSYLKWEFSRVFWLEQEFSWTLGKITNHVSEWWAAQAPGQPGLQDCCLVLATGLWCPGWVYVFNTLKINMS